MRFLKRKPKPNPLTDRFECPLCLRWRKPSEDSGDGICTVCKERQKELANIDRSSEGPRHPGPWKVIAIWQRWREQRKFGD